MKALTASLAKTFPAILSVILLTLTYPPVNLFLLTFVALVPWLRSLRDMDSNWKRSGAIFGALFFSIHMAWLLPFVGRWTGSYGLASVPWLLSSVLQIPYFMLLAWLVHTCYRKNLNWAIPFAWVTVEFLRSSIPLLHFPHGLLATPLAIAPQLIQTASVGTMFLVSAWLVLSNVAIVELFERENARRSIFMAATIVGLGMYSYTRHGQPPTGEKKIVSIGQLGTDLAFGDRQTQQSRIEVATTSIIEQSTLHDSDLLVMPEGLGVAGANTSNPTPPFDLPSTPVLFGMQRGTEPVYQSAFGYDGSWQHTDKTKLVFFGEYVPLRDSIPFLSKFNLPSGDLVPGNSISTMTLGDIEVGPIICFEGMFYEVAQKQTEQGAQLLAIMSIDDWFLDSGLPEQLFASAVFRAVESGLPVVRSASLGHTGWIDARGNVRARLPLGETRVLRAEVTIPEKGDGMPQRGLFPWLAVGVTLFAVAYRPRST